MTILAVLVVVIALAWWDAGVQSRRLKATHLEMLRISSCLAWVDARPPVDNYLPMAEKLGPMCPHGLSGRDGWGNPIQIGFVASTTASQPDWVVWSGGRDGMPDSLDPSDYVHGPNRRIKDDHVYSPAHTMVGRPQDPWQFGWWRLRYGPSAPWQLLTGERAGDIHVNMLSPLARPILVWPGDGHFEPDYLVQADRVLLRAERMGTRGGRTYTVSLEARDGSGNTSEARIDILVPHDQRER